MAEHRAAQSGTFVTGSAAEMVAQQLSVPGIIEVDCYKLDKDSDRVAAYQTTITALKVSSLN